MIDDIVTSTNAGFTKFIGEVINKSLDIGNKTQEAEEVETQKAFEDAKKVSPVPIIYGAKGKIIEYDKYGRHLDVLR